MNEGRQSIGMESESGQSSESGWSDLRTTAMELLRVMFLRKWLFFVPFCVVLSGSLGYSHRIPRKYMSSTVFERRPDVAASKLDWEGGPHRFQAIFRSFDFDIVDREAMCEVADAVGWTDDLPRDAQGRLTEEGERIRRRMGGSIVGGLHYEFITEQEEQHLIRLNYTTSDPARARVLVEGIRDVYIRRTQVRILAFLEEARSFFERKLRESTAQAEQVNDGLLRFQIAYPGIDPQNPNLIAQRALMLESEGEALERRSWEIDADIATREAFMAGEGTGMPLPVTAEPDRISPEELVPNPRRAELQRRIREMGNDITELQTSRYMTERHPEVVLLRRGMQIAAESLASEPESVARAEALAINRASVRQEKARSEVAEEVWEAQRARAEMELSSLKSAKLRIGEDRAGIDQELGLLEKMREDIVAKRRGYFQLQEEAMLAQEQVSLWRDRLDEVEGIVELEATDQGLGISVILPAGSGSRPISPRFWTVLMMSLALAAGAGIGIVLLFELLDHKYRTVGQIMKNTSLPILETIGEIVTPAQRRSRFIRDAVLKPVLALMLFGVTGGSALAAYTSIEHPSRWERWRTKLVRTDASSDRSADIA